VNLFATFSNQTPILALLDDLVVVFGTVGSTVREILVSDILGWGSLAFDSLPGDTITTLASFLIDDTLAEWAYFTFSRG